MDNSVDNYLLGITCEWANSVVSLVKFGNVVFVRQQRLALGKGSKLFIIQNVENDLEQVALAETIENAVKVLESHNDNGETARKLLGVRTEVEFEGRYFEADRFEAGYLGGKRNEIEVVARSGDAISITLLAVFPATTL